MFSRNAFPNKLFLVCASAVSLSAAVLAAPPMSRIPAVGKPEGFHPCGVMSRENFERFAASRALRRAEGNLQAPATHQIIVIRVDFPEIAMTKTKPQTETFFAGLRNYFLENTYGIIAPTATVTSTTSTTNGAYRLSSIYNYNDESDTAMSNLLSAAVAAASADYNFAAFDQIMIYHAGNGEEESDNAADIWSMFNDTSYTVAGKKFPGFTIVPELGQNPLGVTCHEYGHQLGLPDLYNTVSKGGTSTCGAWSLMDYPYGADGSGRPPPLDMWCKNFLNVVNLDSRKIVSRQPSLSLEDISIAPLSATTSYVKIPVDVGGALEYFIIEYRLKSKLTYDNFPASGVVIWHIDDAIALDPSRLSANTINNGVYPSVDLVEADGTSVYPPGQTADAFAEGSLFAAPYSNTFSGAASGVAAADFRFFPSSVTFSVEKIYAASTLELTKALNYPNPAGKNYFHPRPGVMTTVNFRLTRPPQDMNLAIYNISGERILSVPKARLSVRLGPAVGGSVDENWVYEFDWDGKDETGSSVAPGVYLYRLRADGKIKTGKMVVER